MHPGVLVWSIGLVSVSSDLDPFDDPVSFNFYNPFDCFTDLERSEVWSFADLNRVGIRALLYSIACTLHNNTVLPAVAVGVQ